MAKPDSDMCSRLQRFLGIRNLQMEWPDSGRKGTAEARGAAGGGRGRWILTGLGTSLRAAEATASAAGPRSRERALLGVGRVQWGRREGAASEEQAARVSLLRNSCCTYRSPFICRLHSSSSSCGSTTLSGL
jgi:hypothetical protein